MKLIVASNNKKKIAEMKRILQDLDFEVVSLQEAGITTDIEETGVTFAENAYIKAKTIFDMTNTPCIADDSGLEVAALNGEPGVYTARYAGENATDMENIEKLLKCLEGKDNRSAKFVSAICCVLGENEVIETVGECAGEIGVTLLGENGFGYDPIFMVGQKSFAQLRDGEKDKISHRGKALRAFYNKLKEKIEDKK